MERARFRRDLDCRRGQTDERIPAPSGIAFKVYAGLHQAMRKGCVRAAHDLSEGGLGVAAAEMCIGGRLGMELSLPADEAHLTRALFGESNGCLLVEVPGEQAGNFEKHFTGLPFLKLGVVTDNPELKINTMSLTVCDLVKAWIGANL